MFGAYIGQLYYRPVGYVTVYVLLNGVSSDIVVPFLCTV